MRVTLDHAQLKGVVERLRIGNALEDAQKIRIAPTAGVLARSIPGGSIEDGSSILVDVKWRQVRLAEAEQMVAARTGVPDHDIHVAQQRTLNVEVELHEVWTLEIEVYGLNHRQDVARIFRGY